MRGKSCRVRLPWKGRRPAPESPRWPLRPHPRAKSPRCPHRRRPCPARLQGSSCHRCTVRSGSFPPRSKVRTRFSGRGPAETAGYRCSCAHPAQSRRPPCRTLSPVWSGALFWKAGAWLPPPHRWFGADRKAQYKARQRCWNPVCPARDRGWHIVPRRGTGGTPPHRKTPAYPVRWSQTDADWSCQTSRRALFSQAAFRKGWSDRAGSRRAGKPGAAPPVWHACWSRFRGYISSFHHLLTSILNQNTPFFVGELAGKERAFQGSGGSRSVTTLLEKYRSSTAAS